MDGMIDVRQAARQLAVSVSTVRRLVRAGDIAALRVGRQLRIEPHDLETYINTNQVIVRKTDDQ